MKYSIPPLLAAVLSAAVSKLPAVAAVALLLTVASGARAQSGAQPIKELDRIVAVVNDDVIVESELEQRVRTVRAQLKQAGTPAPPAKVLRRQVLERMILDKLQLQVAKRMGLHVDDDTLNRAMHNLAKDNNLTLAEFRRILERDGYDYQKFREQIRHQILIRRVRQRQVEDRVRVTPREIDDYLATRATQGNPNEQYHVLHILIATPEAASSEAIQRARKRAEDVLERLHKGADFSETAVAVSDGQQALQGGNLGWRSAGQLPTIFAKLVPKMKPGDISGLIRSPSGFHIIKLADVRGSTRRLVEQTHARQILIRTSELQNTEDVKRRLERLRTRIENGDNFAVLARSNSEDRMSAAKGGDLGWLNPGEVVPAFQAVMDKLKPGQVSQPFRTRFGWHIVQVLGRRKYDDSKEAARQQAREQIRQRKIQEELDSWLRQLRDEAYVEYRLDQQ